PALLLLLRVVDLVERVEGVHVGHLVVQPLGDRRGQRRLSVVDVPDGADVDVRLSPLELCLRHLYLLVAIRPTAVGLECFLGSLCLLCAAPVTRRAPWR